MSERMISPALGPAGWHNQAQRIDPPIIPRLFGRFEGAEYSGINGVVEFVLGNTGTNHADFGERGQFEGDSGPAAVGDQADRWHPQFVGQGCLRSYGPPQKIHEERMQRRFTATQGDGSFFSLGEFEHPTKYCGVHVRAAFTATEAAVIATHVAAFGDLDVEAHADLNVPALRVGTVDKPISVEG
jgi:hypothetical protein